MASGQSQEKGPRALQSTRQMLDDLDALMERMLAIPVNQPDDPAEPAPDIVRMPTVAATLTVLDPTIDETETLPEIRLPHHATPPSFGSKPTLTHTEKMPSLLDPRDLEALPKTRPHFELEPIPAAAIPPPITELAKSEPASAPESDSLPAPLPRRAGGSILALPIVLLNHIFDAFTYLLGPLGRWLRGPQGRHLLGVAGLLLLVAAGVWLMVDWLGWTW